jgi:hypothetical protein
MPDKMTSRQMAQRINGLIGERGFLYPEAEAIIARLEEADRMEAWIKHTYGDWTDEPDGEKP